jgi:hypothetical protein
MSLWARQESIMRNVLLLCLAIMLAATSGACDGPETEQAKRKSEDQAGQFEAQQKAEEALFSDPVKAEAAIEDRLLRFISVHEGMFVVRESRRHNPEVVVGWHVLPLTTPWRVHCQRGKLEVSIGPQDSEGDIIPALRLARVRLEEDQCRRLALAAGRLLGRPARQ